MIDYITLEQAAFLRESENHGIFENDAGYVYLGDIAVSYTHLTLPTNREV